MLQSCKKYIKILQDGHLVKILQDRLFLARVILQELSITCKKMIISIARLANPARYLFNTCKILQDLQENFIARLAHILQDGFYWDS